ncbi:MAG: hypothetical protein MH204_10440, partial [Fimbriimonadaceae bacterium]|nr:hypothetical protein [Fimbriimonadaceae bacterium]
MSGAWALGLGLALAVQPGEPDRVFSEPPRGTAVYRPVSPNLVPYLAEQLARRSDGPDSVTGPNVSAQPGFGIGLNELTQEDYTTSVVLGEAALGFGIAGFGITAS